MRARPEDVERRRCESTQLWREASVVNEVAQWAALITLTILLLGVFRQVGLLLPPSTRTQVSGPTPGRRAPRPLLEHVRKVTLNGRTEAGTIVAFVTEDCTGCQRLLADLSSSQVARDEPVVLVTRHPSPQFAQAIQETGIPTISADDALWDACGVTATPLVVRIDERGRIAAREVTHRVEAAVQDQ